MADPRLRSHAQQRQDLMVVADSSQEPLPTYLSSKEDEDLQRLVVRRLFLDLHLSAQLWPQSRLEEPSRLDDQTNVSWNVPCSVHDYR